MVRITKSNVLGRAIRADDLPELGVSTVTKALEAIDGGRKAEARELVEYLWREGKGVLHDVYADWVWALFDYIAERFGEEELFRAAKSLLTQHFQRAVELYRNLSPEEHMQLIVESLRALRSGPGQLGDVVIRDEGDRYVIACDPCGSGGRMRRGDPVAKTPPRTQEPYNFGVVKGAYPWTWGKPGIARYCLHCGVGEIVSIELEGFPRLIHEYPDQPGEPCRVIIYKDPESIPEFYYTRVGKSKTQSATL